MADAVSSPLSIVSVPFMDYTTASGSTVRIAGIWLWLLVALGGGVSLCMVVGLILFVFNRVKGSFG